MACINWRCSLFFVTNYRFKEEPVSAFVVVVKALWLEAGFFPGLCFLLDLIWVFFLTG